MGDEAGKLGGSELVVDERVAVHAAESLEESIDLVGKGGAQRIEALGQAGSVPIVQPSSGRSRALQKPRKRGRVEQAIEQRGDALVLAQDVVSAEPPFEGGRLARPD